MKTAKALASPSGFTAWLEEMETIAMLIAPFVGVSFCCSIPFEAFESIVQEVPVIVYPALDIEDPRRTATSAAADLEAILS